MLLGAHEYRQHPCQQSMPVPSQQALSDITPARSSIEACLHGALSAANVRGHPQSRCHPHLHHRPRPTALGPTQHHHHRHPQPHSLHPIRMTYHVQLASFVLFITAYIQHLLQTVITQVRGNAKSCSGMASKSLTFTPTFTNTTWSANSRAPTDCTDSSASAVCTPMSHTSSHRTVVTTTFYSAHCLVA